VIETITTTGPVFSLACPDAGLVRLRPDQLQTHCIDHAAIAAWAALEMGASSAPTEPVANEVWRWDRVHLLGGRERWTLIIGRNLDQGINPKDWRRLGVVAKAIILSMGYKPYPPPEEGPYAYSGSLWSFIDYDEGEWEFLLDELVRGLGDQAPPATGRPKVSRSAARDLRYETMRTFVIAHIESAKSALRSKSGLLPTPERQLLARECGVDKGTISKDLKREDDRAKLVLRLLDIAESEEEIRGFDARQFQ